MYMDILSNLIITRVRSVTKIYMPKGVSKKRSGREHWAISFKYEGETEFTSKKENSISNAQNVMILPKGSTYAWQCKSAGHSYMIEFESDLEFDRVFSVPIKNSAELLKQFQKLEQSRIKNPKTAQIRSINTIYYFILSLIKESEQKYIPSKKRQIILAATDYIAKNYNKRITNEDLAQIAGVSTIYFRKLFTEIVGVSPINYVQNVKVQKAKEMLFSDYSSITDIALSLGYQNIYDFSRAFKKNTGLSPLQYRNQN